MRKENRPHADTLRWQRRFWEHQIQDDADFARHADYIHWNPVKHGLVRRTIEWSSSTFHRFVQSGVYSCDWGLSDAAKMTAGEQV